MGKKGKKVPETAEEAERSIIGAAMELAEKQIREGTASPAILLHFLKAGAIREQLEQEKLINETKLVQAKVSALESAVRTEELVSEALQAFRLYSGGSDAEL